jgi:PilZ domain-containing protein
MGMTSTRRWPRYHVHLPVFISSETDVSTIAVPGVVSEISRGGMELYGGVERRPGDLMEVEFQAAGVPRVAGVVRSRSGFCFGLEFLSLMPGEPSGGQGALRPLSREDGRMTLGELGIASPAKRAKSVGPKHEGDSDDALFVEIFLDRHDTFLREAQIEIQSLRQRALRLKQWREEMESLLQNGLAERSANYPQFFRKA